MKTCLCFTLGILVSMVTIHLDLTFCFPTFYSFSGLREIRSCNLDIGFPACLEVCSVYSIQYLLISSCLLICDSVFL